MSGDPLLTTNMVRSIVLPSSPPPRAPTGAFSSASFASGGATAAVPRAGGRRSGDSGACSASEAAATDEPAPPPPTALQPSSSSKGVGALIERFNHHRDNDHPVPDKDNKDDHGCSGHPYRQQKGGGSGGRSSVAVEDPTATIPSGLSPHASTTSQGLHHRGGAVQGARAPAPPPAVQSSSWTPKKAETPSPVALKAKAMTPPSSSTTTTPSPPTVRTSTTPFPRTTPTLASSSFHRAYPPSSSSGGGGDRFSAVSANRATATVSAKAAAAAATTNKGDGGDAAPATVHQGPSPTTKGTGGLRSRIAAFENQKPNLPQQQRTPPLKVTRSGTGRSGELGPVSPSPRSATVRPTGVAGIAPRGSPPPPAASTSISGPPQRLGGTYLYLVGGKTASSANSNANASPEVKGEDEEANTTAELAVPPPPPTPTGAVTQGRVKTFPTAATTRLPSASKQFRGIPSTGSHPPTIATVQPPVGPAAATTLPPQGPPPPDFGDLSPIPDVAFAGDPPSSKQTVIAGNAAAADNHRLRLPDDSLTDEDENEDLASDARRYRRTTEPVAVTDAAPPAFTGGGSSSRFKVLSSHKHASTSSSFQNRLLQFSQTVASTKDAAGAHTKAQSPHVVGTDRETPLPLAASAIAGETVRPTPGSVPVPPWESDPASAEAPDLAAYVRPSTSRPAHKVLSATKHSSGRSAFQNRLLQFSQKLPSPNASGEGGGIPTRRPVPVGPVPIAKPHPSARNLDPNLMPGAACHSLEPTEETSIGSTTDDDLDHDPELPHPDLSSDDARPPAVWDKGSVVPLASLCDISAELPTPDRGDVRTRGALASGAVVVTPPSPDGIRPSRAGGDGPAPTSHIQRLRNAFEVAISPATASGAIPRTASPPAEVSQEGFEVAAAHNVSVSSEPPSDREPAVMEDRAARPPAPQRPGLIEGELDSLLALQAYADPPLTLPDDSTIELDELEAALPVVATARQQPEPVHGNSLRSPSRKPASLSLLSRKPSNGEGPPIPPGGDGRGPQSKNEPPHDEACVFESYDGLSSSGQLSVQRLSSALFTEEALIDSATSPRVMKEDWLPRSKEGRAKAGLPPAGEVHDAHVVQPRPLASPEEELLEASLEPPSTVRKTPPRSDAVLMSDLDFLAPTVAVAPLPENTPLIPPPDTVPLKAAVKKLRPNPKDTGRSKGRSRCGPNSDESHGACPVATVVDRTSSSGGKGDSSQSRIHMLPSVLSSPDPTPVETEAKRDSPVAPAFSSLANESLAHETPVSTCGKTSRSGPVDLDDTVEESFESSNEHNSLPITSGAEEEDPFQVDYAGLITRSASLGESKESPAPMNTSTLRLAPNPKDTSRAPRSKGRSVTINANPEYSALQQHGGIQVDDDFDVHHESSSSQPESVSTSVSAESPSKANQSPNWKVTRSISQTNPMWTALDGEERIKKWRQLRRRQSEGHESSYSEGYESTTASEQDSDGRVSSSPHLKASGASSLDQQWQLFNPMDAKNPLVAYYEPPSTLRPRKIDKSSKRSTRPTRKSPRTVPPMTSGMMVEI